MKRIVVTCALALPFLTACNESGSAASAPEVEGVHTRYYVTHENYDDEFTSLLRYFVVASDAGGLENIEHIEIMRPNRDHWLTIHDTRPTTDDYRDGLNSDGFFSSNNYYSISEPNRREIQGYEVRVTNSAGASTTQSFDLTVPEDWLNGNETFIYDYKYSGSDTASGIAGLDFANVDNVVIDSETLDLGLTVTDDRTLEVIVEFYAYDPEEEGTFSGYHWVGATRILTNDDFDPGVHKPFTFDLDDESQFELNPFSDRLLTEATHVIVLSRGPKEPVRIDGVDIDLRSFLAHTEWQAIE